MRVLPRWLFFSAVVLCLTAGVGAQSERRLELSFNNGLVTLKAANVTVSDILAEWARRGGTLVVNGDRLTAGVLPVPVQFENQPERLVLDSLLRMGRAAMWILELRANDMNATVQQSGTPAQSVYARVQILPNSNPTSNTPYVTTPPVSIQQGPPPGFGAPEDEIPPVTPVQNPGQPPARPGPVPVVTGPPGQVVPIQAVPPGAPGTTGRGRGSLR